MGKKIKIALDGMGGDNAPFIVVEGASIAKKRNKKLDFVIFGDEKKISPLIEKYKNLKNCIKIVHTDEIVSANEKPSTALRRCRNSSMTLAINSVKEGKCDCIVSAGNTGALMAISLFALRPLKGVNRPAICTVMPSLKEDIVVLDLGANSQCDAETLRQFAIMGSVFHNILVKKKNQNRKTSVGLLNIGSEAGKGNKVVQETNQILLNDENINYKGFVEGDDISKGVVDVFVTDGFTGNIVLKVIEGTAKLIGGISKNKLLGSVFGWLSLVFLFPVFFKIKKKLDPSRYNGAVLLGLNGVSIKSHGSASSYSYSHAIDVAYDLVRNDCKNKLKEKININE